MKKLMVAMAVAVLVFACGDGSDPEDNRYEYTVTFQRAVIDIPGEVMTTVKVKEGDKLTKPQNNTAKAGEEFLGWFNVLSVHKNDNNYMNSDKVIPAAVPYDFDQPVNGDMTLYGRIAVQKKLSAGSDFGYTSGLSIFSEDVFQYHYCDPKGNIIHIGLMDDGSNGPKGLNISIYKNIEPNTEFMINGSKYVYEYGGVGMSFDGYFRSAMERNKDYCYAKSDNNYFEVGAKDYIHYIGFFGPYDEMSGWYVGLKSINAHCVRIRDISTQAVYIAGGTFWEEGYYYRIESWNEQYLASLEE